ncbi:MAG: hypothetical protein PHT49_11720 [Desulfovibrionales bacterium]|nr:hypothetical protein [Desulfovibrionales bacterium]
MKISQHTLIAEVREIIDGILEDKRFQFLAERGFLTKDNSPSAPALSPPNYRLQKFLWDSEVVRKTTDYFNMLKSNVNDWFIKDFLALEKTDADQLIKEGLVEANNEITKKGRGAVIQIIDEFITSKIKPVKAKQRRP